VRSIINYLSSKNKEISLIKVLENLSKAIAKQIKIYLDSPEDKDVLFIGIQFIDTVVQRLIDHNIKFVNN